MPAKQSEDAISDIRDDYKKLKHQLDHYDSFVDNNQLAFSALFVVGGISCLVMASFLKNILFMYVAAVLLISMIIFAFISGARQSKKNKIKQKINDLKDEMQTLRRHANSNVENISRDEIGLFAEETNLNTNRNIKGIVIAVLIVTAIIVPIVVVQNNAHNEEILKQELRAEQERQRQNDIRQNYQSQIDQLNDSSQDSKSTYCSSYIGENTVDTTCQEY